MKKKGVKGKTWKDNHHSRPLSHMLETKLHPNLKINRCIQTVSHTKIDLRINTSTVYLRTLMRNQ